MTHQFKSCLKSCRMETVLSSGGGGEISVINNHGTSRLLIGQLPGGTSPVFQNSARADTLFYPQMLSGVHKGRCGDAVFGRSACV